MPLAVLWTEAGIVRDRENDRISTETLLIQAAIVDVLAGGSHLGTALKELRGE